jgi:glutamate transport system substrate-binding protein
LSLVVASLTLAACTGAGAGTVTLLDKIVRDHRVVVGTKWDQQGLGLKAGSGEPQGFDVDVAKYVVTELAGGQDVDIEWKESISANREAFLANGGVDITVSAYSITGRVRRK